MLVDTVSNANESYIIFASHQTYADIQSALHTNDVTKLQGCYKGVKEDAYIVNAKNRCFIYHSSILTEQESVLNLGPVDTKLFVRPAVLQYLNQRTPAEIEFLGYLWPVIEEIALKHDAWTKRGNSYYVAAFEHPK